MEETIGLAGRLNGIKKTTESNSLITDLEKAAALRKLVAEDPGMEDATMQMLIMAQGPKAFSYLMPEVTAAGRVTNAVKEKNINRMVGLPREKDVRAFLSSPTSRDKVMWTTTGNVIKGVGVSDRIDNE